MYRNFFKRFLDIIISVLAIILLLPVYIVIAILVKINLGSPILYRQERIGFKENPFYLYKFRTMTNETDENGNILPEEKRLTKIGKILRSSSLDEIPELFSILTGDMSIVGPRPMPTYYGPYFLSHERRRHEIRGGLIPPDSLSGKTYTSYEEQFKYEINYVDSVSFVLDIKIILMTFKILFNRVASDYGADFERPHLNVYRSAIKETDE